MLRRFSPSNYIIAAVVILAMSDMVQADTFGPAAPLVLALQQLGGTIALAVEGALSPVLGQLSGSMGGFPVSPGLILGGGVAIALNMVRARARRERSRRG